MKKKTQIFCKKIVQLLFKFIYGKIELEKNKNIYQNITIKESKDRFFINENLKYRTYNISKGRVYTDYVENVATISDNKLFSKGSFQQIRGRLVAAKLNCVINKGTPRIKKKFRGTILNLVQGASSQNYFHWLIDILPKIFICSKNYKISKINYFYLPQLTKSQIESLKLIGIDKSKIINSKEYRHIEGERIITVDHPWYKKGFVHDYSHTIPKWIILWLKNEFIKYKKKFQCNKKIYIDRSESKFKHCQIINNKEVDSFLKTKGFKKYKVGKLNFAKQIFLFCNAKFIISAHGAALTNLVFCRPGTKVLEIRPENHPGKNYQRICKVNKLKYFLLKTEKINKINENKGDIYLSINRLEKKIGKLNLII
jgi:capsular polysaccharide biosynthesis protein